MSEQDEWVSTNEQNDVHDFEVNKSIEGKYLIKKEHIGANDSNMYSIKTKDGVRDIWGGTVIDGEMSKIAPGAYVKITATGEQKPKSGAKPYKTYNVQYKLSTNPAVLPEGNDVDTPTDEPPF